MSTKIHNSTSCVHKYLVFSWFDFFTTCLFKSKNVSYLHEIINRVLSWFDWLLRYDKNVRKLISPQVLCTSITNRVLSWFDRFTDYYYCMRKKFHKTQISTSFVHKLPNRVVSLFDRFTSYYNCMKEKCHKTHLCASFVHKCHKPCSYLIWPFHG